MGDGYGRPTTEKPTRVEVGHFIVYICCKKYYTAIFIPILERDLSNVTLGASYTTDSRPINS